MPRRVPSAFRRSIPRPSGALGALAVTAVACLSAAPAALADSTTSGNWAGYAAHRSGVHFRSVTGRWRVPNGSCHPGHPGYSSVWVGLGGYSRISQALEQTGTELDCTRSGRAVYSAWYELVPAAPHLVRVGVRGGDLVQAAVTASGHRVTLYLQDLTDHRTFRQTRYAAQIDISSADWIVEAPSACDAGGACFTLPLADFGSATISSARAVTLSGHSGSVTSRWWGITTINLAPHATRFFADTADTAAGRATPSPLTAGGSVFSVTYQASSSSSAGQAGPAPHASGHLVHARRWATNTLVSIIS